ncbi:MAG: glycosyltransferase [Pseudomonadota bacterium]
MRRFLRLALIERFITSWREEGVRPALQKARNYFILQWHGRAPSFLRGSGSGRTAPEHYLRGTWADIARGEGFHTVRRLEDGPRLALIGDLNLSQCRKYRVEQLAEFWRAQGVDVEFSHYQDVPRCVRILQNATHLMEYRLQAMPLTEMYRYEARRLGLPILWDIDDPLFSVSAYETYGNMAKVPPELKAHFVSEAPKYASMMNGADILSFSTPGLAEHAGLYTSRPAYVRRNFADAATLANGAEAMAQKVQHNDFTVVFASGSKGHEADFDEIAEPLEAFVTADPARRLMILGHFDMEALSPALAAQAERHAFIPYDGYLSTLASADVAVMPLMDDLFNHAKSGVRVIDAASVGVPSIVSSVGDLSSLVAPETGFVAQSSADWLHALETLAADRARAKAMGHAARKALETDWSGQAKEHIISPELIEWVHR